MKYPTHHWGSSAEDPWSASLDVVSGLAWEEAVAIEREVVLGSTEPQRWSAGV